ncbi:MULTISPECIES: YhjD/YihY/BrkB family envelope integrity protein [unclassified Pseudodesulfovibrio]|uniref:YhjD/YihY/BrkB family envelope integrity protein n=1 Tax=unclassified Pseudodesulfovibrio TaxID=2661612 RepID=UPI000FEBB3CD|nr:MULTISPECIES: YhjD/YihY/BrkB family envelope integrity protein [unclassified Pseudodesulfovibrio]MCJ2163983.1 YihY family inner membrane protein [Pseudodesulfovibrio sp. S3-i]RWU05377.1 YihY family inner membrane protein [Pseudodesulfovibrio sp. S3]
MSAARIAWTSTRLKRHFKEGIWVRNTPETPFYIRLWRGTLRLLYLVGFGFVKDQTVIRAAALTFTTILSIVPFLAVAFSISKGFGLQNNEYIRTLILKLTTGRVEVADKIIEYIDRTNVQALGWVGVATLLFTVFSLVGTTEKAFNTIWNVTKGRSAWRKVADFFPVILICPLVLVVASSFNISLQQQQMVAGLLSVEAIGFLESVFMKVAPYVLISLAFMFMYAFIPYTRVDFVAALIGGVVGGVLWQMAQWLYINWQIGAAKYNAIYGSFAQLPVLLIWIYISWVIVLLGSQVSYAWQNINSFVKQRFFGQATPYERQKIAVLMMIVLAKRFHEGKPLPSVEEMSDGLMAPATLVSDLFTVLQRAGYTILADVQGCEVYAPARELENVRVLDIIRAINLEGQKRVFEEFDVKYGFLDKILGQLGKDTAQSKANLTLLECSEQYPGAVLSIAPEDEGMGRCLRPGE